MHMISTMDFFFISCVKCQSVNGGAAESSSQITPPTHTRTSSPHWRDLTIGINMREAFPLHL